MHVSLPICYSEHPPSTQETGSQSNDDPFMQVPSIGEASAPRACTGPRGGRGRSVALVKRPPPGAMTEGWSLFSDRYESKQSWSLPLVWQDSPSWVQHGAVEPQRSP